MDTSSKNKNWLILIAIVFTALVSCVQNLHAQGSANCAGPCTYGVEGRCQPNKVFGYHVTTWRKWPEAPPPVPTRSTISTASQGNDGGDANLDLPEPGDESETNPEFSHLKDNDGNDLSSDLGYSETDSFNSPAPVIDMPSVETSEDTEDVPPRPDISTPNPTDPPSVDLPPLDAEDSAPLNIPSAPNSFETPNTNDFDLDLNSNRSIGDGNSRLVNYLRSEPTTTSVGNPLRVAAYVEPTPRVEPSFAPTSFPAPTFAPTPTGPSTYAAPAPRVVNPKQRVNNPLR